MPHTPRRILLTGATGFLGHYIARDLLTRGDTVTALVRQTSITTKLPSTCAVAVHDGTTAGLFEIIDTVRPAIIIHAATLFLATHEPDQIEAMIRANILFGAQLLDAMARSGVNHLLNFGTAWQHFGSDGYRPANLYAATKQSFDDIAAYYADADGISVLTLKLPDTYGPEDPRQKLIHLLMEVATTGAELSMSPGEQTINLLHSDDVVAAVRVAIDRLEISDPGIETFAIRGSETVSLKELVVIVERVLGMPLAIRWGGRPYRDREVMRPWVGPLLPGWQPKIDLATGLSALARSLRKTK